jgi:hypothetical protein
VAFSNWLGKIGMPARAAFPLANRTNRLLAEVVELIPARTMFARVSRPVPLFDFVIVLGVLVVAMVRLIGLVQACAVNLLYQDQWDLMRPIFENQGPLGCFYWQHGPHRQGLGGVINWYLYRATAWDVRAEAWVEIAILFLAALAAIVLSVRLRGRLKWTDAAYPLLLINPLHWETILLTPNMAHSILPVLLVLLLAHAWISRHWVVRLLSVGILNLLCLFTGFGFCAFASSTLLLAWLLLRSDEEERRRLLGIAVLAALTVAAFGWHYRWDPAVPGWRFPVANWWDYPRFMAFMYSSLLGWRAMSWGPVLAGGGVLALVIGAFVWSAKSIGQRPLRVEMQAVWLLTATTLLYGAFTAIGRLPVNIEAAFMWRYLTLLVPGICGLLLLVQSEADRASVRVRGASTMVLLALALVIWGNFLPENHAAAVARAKTRWIEKYRASRDLAVTNAQADFTIYGTDPNPPMIAARLRWLDHENLSFFKDKAANPAIMQE